jgi:hypothetical protein
MATETIKGKVCKACKTPAPAKERRICDQCGARSQILRTPSYSAAGDIPGWMAIYGALNGQHTMIELCPACAQIVEDAVPKAAEASRIR